jgi:hypothetical protein
MFFRSRFSKPTSGRATTRHQGPVVQLDSGLHRASANQWTMDHSRLSASAETREYCRRVQPSSDSGISIRVAGRESHWQSPNPNCLAPRTPCELNLWPRQSGTAKETEDAYRNMDIRDKEVPIGVNRRSFLTGATIFGLGAATSAVVSGCGGTAAMKATSVSAAGATDSAADIRTAALIAESLAITTYCTALSSSGVITDPNLAGPGGTAVNISSTGSPINVGYLQGALLQEVSHAQTLHSLLGPAASGSGDAAASVPQTFYFPAGTFDSLSNFLPVLIAPETASIGAYMTAVEEFASMAAGFNGFSGTQPDASKAGSNLTGTDLVLRQGGCIHPGVRIRTSRPGARHPVGHSGFAQLRRDESDPRQRRQL